MADDAIGLEFLAEDVRGQFESADVYIRGVSPRTPRHIRYTKSLTVIPPSAMRPLDQPAWDEIARTYEFAELEEAVGAGRDIVLPLGQRPSSDRMRTVVDFSRYAADGSEALGISTEQFDSKLYLEGGKCYVRLPLTAIVKVLRKARVNKTTPIAVTVHFTV